jgi:hypothetical protein
MADLVFDEGPKCDLTTWHFPELGENNGESILHPDFVKSMLAEISEVIDEEVRKSCEASLWNVAKEGEQFNPALLVSLSLDGDGDGMGARISLLELVNQCIDVNRGDAPELTAWGDYFKRCAELFHAAARG